GNSAGPLFGGVVADLAGPRVTFVATSALLALAAFIVITRVDEEFVPKPKSTSLLRNALPDFSVLAKSPALASLLFVTFSVQLANGVVGPIMPLIVLDMTGGGPAVASLSGLIIAASSLAGALAAAVVGKLSARLGYGRALLMCLVGAFAFYLPQSLASSPYLLLALRLGSGFFLGGTMPSVNALIAKLCDPGKQGSTYGLSSSVSSAGAAVGPALGAVIATSAGYPAVFLATSGILAATGLAVGAAVRGRERRGGGPSGPAAGSPAG
ncbi:MAG: MFS transporter, partial [Spirochaetaceae bacterium]|nr:MFS transporter [Spirochaetaceae bacterium]